MKIHENIVFFLCIYIVLRYKTQADEKAKSNKLNQRPLYSISYPDLMNLCNLEKKIYHVLKRIQMTTLVITEHKKEDNRYFISLIKDYKMDYENDTIIEKFRKAKVKKNRHEENQKVHKADHPFLGFKVIKRFAIHLTQIREFIKLGTNEKYPGLLQEIEEILPHELWPTTKDLEDVMHGILRLQYVYDIDPKYYTKGIIPGSSFQKTLLTSIDALIFGSFAGKNKYFTLALDWLKSGLKSLRSDYASLHDKLEFIRIINGVISEHDRSWTESSTNLHMFTMPIKYSKGEWKKPQSFIQYGQENFSGTRKKDFETLDFISLCRGNNFQTDMEKSKLKCFYGGISKDAYWLINPLKIEFHSVEPLLIEIYNVLNDEEMESLKKLAILQMEPTKVAVLSKKESKIGNDYDLGEYVIDKVRASYQSLLFETHPLLAKLSLKIEKMVGLKVSNSSSEPMKILSYAFGGYFNVHHDTYTDKSYELHRMATFMIYLNNVEQGGNTAFPALGLSIEPKKGSALFWFNSHRNGTADERMFHGGCPVLLGSKWLANKWILAGNNFMTHPCRK